MKKCVWILAAALLLSVCGCTDYRMQEEGDVEKPAIYLYPESSEYAAPEKPTIYLYPENSSCEESERDGDVTEEKPAVYLYPENSAYEEPERHENIVLKKPAVSLYPKRATKVHVKLHYTGTLTCTYPEYKDGWTVWATPEGILTDENGREYNYLFWEGASQGDWDMSRGFVVAGADTADFLERTLARLGLNDREAGDFITYWLPRMQGNPYNLVTFQTDAYTEKAQLEITPEPDSVLRVFMVFQPLKEPVSIPEPELLGFERKGFTVIEWGGAELKP